MYTVTYMYTCHLPFGIYGTSIHVIYLLVYMVPIYMSLTFWYIRYPYTCHLPFVVYGSSIHITYLLVYTVAVYTVYTKL